MKEPSMANPKSSVLSTVPPLTEPPPAEAPRRFRRLRKLTSHIPPGQFVRYLLVGTWNTLFGYGVYALFTALLMHKSRFGYLYAAVLSGIVSITVAYFGYKFFVFKTRDRYWTEWLRCVLVYGTAMLPGLILLPIAVEALRHGFHLGASAPYLGGALTTGFTAFYGFLGHKHFTFRAPAQVACSSAEAEPALRDAATGDRQSDR